MNDTDRVRLSYEELGRPEVDQALAEIRKRKKATAVQANAGVKDTRTRTVKRLLLMVAAGFLSLILLLSLLYFGRSLIFGKSDPTKSRLEQKSVKV